MNNNTKDAIQFIPSLAAIIGFVLIVCQLANNSVGLTIAVVAVGSVALVGYALQMTLPNRTNFTAEICTFCWLFIVTLNVMRLIVGVL
jgi:hypothetical protein